MSRRKYDPTMNRTAPGFWERRREEYDARLAQEAASPPAVAGWLFRCSACGLRLSRMEFEPMPRACPLHPDAAAETSEPRDEEALKRVAGRTGAGIEYRAHVKVTPEDIALARIRVERWGGCPDDIAPADVPVIQERVSLYGVARP